MSSKKRRAAEAGPSGLSQTRSAVAVAESPTREGPAWWVFALGFLAVLALGFEVYGPALGGEFLFDDQYLPFLIPDVQHAPLRAWLGVRPFLMLSYWLNYQSSGLHPTPYHAVSIVFHCLNAVLTWSIVRRLLRMGGDSGVRSEILAAFAGALFLVHPVQTESVAYVSSRSEAMSIFFFLLAYAVFLFRSATAISVPRVLLLLVLFGIACTVKEHTTVLPALLLLTDFWFTTPFRFEAIRKNLQLYVPIAIGGVLGLAAVWKVLSTAKSAGFRLQDMSWYQYLFTQFRVIWEYVRLFFFPFRLNGDYVYPVSRNLFDHGAIFGLVGLAAVSVLAWRYRRSYPLASFGWFAFLILLAPTSSVVPIQDVIAERRLYLPFLGLLLILIDFLRRWKSTPALLVSGLSIVLVAASVAAHERSKVWSSALAFWTDVVQKSPSNSRARFQLAYAQWQTGNCVDAVRNYEEVARLTKPDERLLVDWALGLDCLDRTDEAVAKLRQAFALVPSALTQAQIGMIYGKRGRFDEALRALDEAERIEPRFEMTYVYKGNIAAARGDYASATAAYNRALAINPNNEAAAGALAIAQQNGATRGRAAQP